MYLKVWIVLYYYLSMDFRSHTLPLFHLSKMLTLTDMYNYHIGLLVHSIQFNSIYS